MTNKLLEFSGYPSIDKPWLKYYDMKPEDLLYQEKTLFQYVWDNNKDRLDETVMMYFGKKISYRTFFDKVQQAAKAFRSFGIESGDMVTIMSMHTPETIYAFYGLNYIGAIANMVYMTLSAKEITDTIANTNSKILMILDVATDRIEAIKESLSIPIVLLSVDESMPVLIKGIYRLKTGQVNKELLEGILSYHSFLEKGEKQSELSPESDSSAMAVIVYTSGTTGEPKGACLSNKAMNDLAVQDVNGLIKFQRGMTCLMILPPFIGFGITHIHILISSGIVSIIQINLESKAIADSLFKYKPYVFMTGPAFVSGIIEHKDSDLTGLKYCIGGGGAITEQQEQAINDKLRRCHSQAVYSNGYGMTEASSVLSTNVNEISKPGSVGIPFLDTIVKAVDLDTGNELSYNRIGELWFSSPNLMMGYYKNQKSTDETIVVDENGRRWLRTGDLGCVDEDGFVYIKGRIKRIYITRGSDGLAYKLFPQRIEETLMDMSIVSSCGVIVKEDEARMNIAIAYVELSDMNKLPNKREEVCTQLKEHAIKELAEHMVPVDIRIVDDMPKTPSGKIDYRALEDMDAMA